MTAGRRFDLGAILLAAVVAVVVPTLTLLDLAVAGRAVAAVVFLAIVPGVPLAYALRLPDRVVTVVLAVCLSVAGTLLSAAVSILIGAWDPFTAVTVLAALGLVATPFAVAAAESRSSIPSGRTALAPRVVGLLWVAVALALWWVATRQTEAGAAGPVGLVAVAPVTYWLALLVLAAVLAWSLLRDTLDHVVLGAAAVAFAVCGYLLVSVADGAAGVGTAWVHVGFVDFVSRTETLATGWDARFSWPGFLSGSAQLVAVGGLSDAGPLTTAAPLFFTVLALPALWLIGRVVTGSPRLAWLGVVLYLAFNWYQQDYFSAQATGFVLYTGVIAVLLWAFDAADVPAVPGSRWWAWRRALHRIPGRPATVGAARMVLLEVGLTLVIAALVVTHQLTPVALVMALVWFVLAGATRLRTLWVSAAALFVGWFSFGATGFWTGHLQDLFGDLGRVGDTVSSGVGERLVGDPLYQQMQFSRIGWTGLLGLLGLVGWLLLRRRRGAALVAGLAAAPAALLLVQSYGGEVVIRCALYASPVLAPLAAVTVSRVGRLLLVPRPLPVRFGVVTAALAVAFAMLTLTRGLNVSFERVTADQVAQARAVIAAAPEGAVIGTTEAVGPLPLGGLGQVRTTAMPPLGCRGELRACLLDQVGDDGSRGPELVYVTSGQEAQGVLVSGLPAGWTGQIVDTLLSTGGYRTVSRSADVTVLQRIAMPAAPEAGES